MPYLLDANVFIQAKQRHYGFDFCPALWEWVIAENARGNAFSIEKVDDELQAIADDLSAWAEARGSAFFLPLTEPVLPSLEVVSQWVNSQSYEPAAIATFLEAADFYLVAQAHAGGVTVVTHEVAAASRKIIKIPNVCIGVGVAFMTPFEMLRRERARFVLG